MYRNSIKPRVDLLAAAFLIIILAPLFAAVAVAIRLFDAGPVLFRQRRVGAGGQPFELYKFRSMPVNTGDIPSDQLGSVRLKPLGRFLRRSNLDELPQLFNILRGEMSLIGPRPSLESQAELIDLRRRSGALDCRPGLTGLAQVSSYDGMPVDVKAGFDAEYARRLSFGLDVVIIARTFLYLLRPPPKY